MRLIDADALSESIRNGAGTPIQKFFADACVAAEKTVEYVAPIAHGKWEHTHTSESYFNECWRCSVCGFDDTEGFGFKFCPNCGAKMDLE